MKKVFSTIVNVVLVAVILFAASVMILAGINAKSGKPTTILGYGFMAVQTGSMDPTYPIGSVIIIKKTDPAKLKVDDAITFYSSDPSLNNKIITHRIVDVIDDGDGTFSFTTKGDAKHVFVDAYPAQGEKVIGKVIMKSWVMEKLINVRNNPATFFVLILIPMCAIIALQVFDISKKSAAIKESKNDEDKK